ncbi:hypothetical protein LWC34_30080 [Kibdelosporangium philippinense]|uniref:Uncharacterized protein n=1 Tax=Kibdelosporangium philippinense TaxID=211113 RepID=A0ABS8ZML7_9PSEU|nr:hypothetical protein [Kibdelosporangium philippinense]MCE7007047.1 hypothetical protein [Kibdelosporangium philippinense]
MTEPMTLAVFAHDLRRRLEALSVDQVRDIVLAYGQGLPGQGRAAFLDLFPATAVAASQARAGERRDDGLLSDIESFASDLAAGKYFLGFGWDDEIRDKRSFGDESWVQVMDALFARADAVFLGGNMSRARDAYAALVQAFHLDEEVGTFCGRQSPEEMVDTDLREASARYLRTIWHTSEAEDMPADLRDAWTDDLPHTCRPVSIDEVRQAHAEDLPGLDAFWPRWIDELRWVEGDPLMRGLLTEAVQRSAGVDGLAVLARERGDRQAEHCLAWIDALAAEGRDADAVAAARESLTMVADSGPGRARIADRLADLGDLLDARREAWRAEPTDLRLRALYEAASDPTAVLAAEAAREHDRVDGRLRAELLLLTDDVDQAVRLLDSDAYDHVLPVLLPYLLAAGSGAVSQQDWTGSALSVFFDGMDRRWGAPPQTPPARLPDLLLRRLADLPPCHRWLEIAGAEVERMISRIVSSKQQARYGEAATLAVCHAEASAWSGGDGVVLLESVFYAYPRHRAFKDQLRKALARSAKMTAATGGVL